MLHIAHEIRSTWEDLWFEFTDVVPSLMTLFSVEWMTLIKLFEVVAKVGNPSFFRGALTVVQSWSKTVERSMKNTY